MEKDLSLRERRLGELRACNELSARYGLALKEEDMLALCAQRDDALKSTGRVELFGQSILKKLIYAFCDSPYIQQEDYAETLEDLVDCFYYFKNESMELLSDDELIDFMRSRFDAYEGSVDYVRGTSLEALCHCVRFGEDYEL